MTDEHKWKGGGIPFGYKYNENNFQLEVDPKEYSILIEIFTYATKGLGVNRIANELNAKRIPPRRGREWTSSTISYILSPARLKYYSGINKDDSPGDWPPILSPNEYEWLSKKPEEPIKPIKIREPKSNNYLLSGMGIFKCGYCGGNVKASVTGSGLKKSLYYYCSRRQNAGPASCKESRLHRQQLIDELVIADLMETTSKDIFDFIVGYTDKLKASYKKEVVEIFKAISTGFFKDSQIDLDRAVEFIEMGYKKFSEIKTKSNNITLPVEIDLRNLKKSVKDNIDEIILLNDEIEIIYFFPIAENLTQSKSIRF